MVCWRASPFSGLNRWFSRQSPTLSGPSAASISALRVAKPRMNSHSAAAVAAGSANIASTPATMSAVSRCLMVSPAPPWRPAASIAAFRRACPSGIVFPRKQESILLILASRKS